MKSLSTDTLAYQLGVRPALQARDMSSAPLRKVVDQLNSFMGLSRVFDWIGHGKKSPEGLIGDPQKDALVFYLLKHAESCLRKMYDPLEPLPNEAMDILETYHEQMAVRGARMFYYLLQICVRESRHSHGAKSSKIEKELRLKYSDAVVDFHKKLESLNETAAVELFRTSAPDVPLGVWTGFMTEQFRNYSYGSAYGQEKWGQIADVVNDFVQGKISLMLLLDRSFALSHNTSPAFDKGMLFTHYDHELLKVLDVQNSGQIPQLVYEKGVKAVDGDASKLLDLCLYGIPERMLLPLVYVDWYKVEQDYAALSDELKGKKGHSASYPAEKQKQAKLYGIPGDTKAKGFVQGVKAAQEAKAKAEVLGLVPIFAASIGKPQSLKKIARKDFDK